MLTMASWMLRNARQRHGAMERLQGTSIGAVLLRAQLDGSAVEQQPDSSRSRPIARGNLPITSTVVHKLRTFSLHNMLLTASTVTAEQPAKAIGKARCKRIQEGKARWAVMASPWLRRRRRTPLPPACEQRATTRFARIATTTPSPATPKRSRPVPRTTGCSPTAPPRTPS